MADLVKPFSGKDYHKNASGHENRACVVCGRAVHDNRFVRVAAGGARFATQVETDSEDGDSSDMGFFHVGSECAKRVKAAGGILVKMPSDHVALVLDHGD